MLTVNSLVEYDTEKLVTSYYDDIKKTCEFRHYSTSFFLIADAFCFEELRWG